MFFWHPRTRFRPIEKFVEYDFFLMRRSLTKAIRLVVAVAVLFLIVALGSHISGWSKGSILFASIPHRASTNEPLHLKTSPLHFRLKDFETIDLAAESLRSKFHPDSHLYSGYASFLQTFDLERSAMTAPLRQKCDHFFADLGRRDPKWKMPTFDGFNDNIADIGGFVNSAKSNLESQWREANPEKEYVFDENEQNKVCDEFDESARKTLKISHEMSDVTTIMRVFGKCFFNDDPDRDMGLYQKYFQKIYGFLGNTLPKYHHANSGTTIEGALPKFDENNVLVGTIPYTPKTRNLVEFMRKSINGKGIVISANSVYQNDLLGLIRVLRAANNKLPIQIFHLGDLSDSTQLVLYYHATADIDDLIKKKTWEDGKDILPNLDLLKEHAKYGSEFPAQDLWFVDVGGCLSDFENKFTWFYNKILAYYFNSFAEIIYMDTDAVPLVNTQAFFDSKEYSSTGTYFFKDRALKEKLRYQDAATLLSLSPTNKISIDTVFGIPLLTEKTKSNLYFLGWFHNQESGIIAYDRKRHYNANLMIMPLTIWNNVICGMIYGDKEMYWMSMVMAGDEDYAFNANNAAAVGRSLVDPKNSDQPHLAVNSVCTTHPGHVNDDGQLLWINSGFKFCKMNDWDADRAHPSFEAFSDDQLQLLYDEPLRLEAAVVPPPPPHLWERGLPVRHREIVEAAQLFDYLGNDRDKKHLKFADEKSITGVQSGWKSTGACLNYEYCAYDKIISYLKDKVYDYGKYYKFSEQEVDRFNYYGKLWMDL